MDSRSVCSLTLVAALVGGCDLSAAAEGTIDRPARIVSGDLAPLTIVKADGVVSLRTEIAATVSTRAQGLMERRSLAADAGMLFLYPGPQSPDAGFWMYRTRIPLDIAFLDADGRILAIRSMEPCESAVASRCPTFAAGVPYHAALEVNRGFFARNGVAPGDRVVPPPGVSGQGAPE